MDDISYRKLRNIVTIAPKPQITWMDRTFKRQNCGSSGFSEVVIKKWKLIWKKLKIS